MSAPSDRIAALGIEVLMPNFGDAASQDQHLREVERAERAARAQFTVAPGCSVKMAERLHGAGEVLEAPTAAHVAAFRQLATRGAVIIVDPAEVERRRARANIDGRYRVRIEGRGVLQAPNGASFHDGEPIQAADLISKDDVGGELALRDFIARRLVVDTRARRS